MFIGRPFRNALCRFLAMALLLAQMAVSAFACTGAQAMTTVAMPDCAGMATDSSSRSALCAAHCQQEQQNDQAQVPALPTVVLARLYTLPEQAEPGLTARRVGAPRGPFAAADPPHAILHCCLRT